MGKGRQGRIKIWVACPAGVGSSTLIKIVVEEVMQEYGLNKAVEVETVGSDIAKIADCDILLCTLNLSSRFSKQLSIPVVGLKNVMDKKEYRDNLVPVVKQLMEPPPKPPA